MDALPSFVGRKNENVFGKKNVCVSLWNDEFFENWVIIDGSVTLMTSYIWLWNYDSCRFMRISSTVQERIDKHASCRTAKNPYDVFRWTHFLIFSQHVDTESRGWFCIIQHLIILFHHLYLKEKVKSQLEPNRSLEWTLILSSKRSIQTQLLRFFTKENNHTPNDHWVGKPPSKMYSWLSKKKSSPICGWSFGVCTWIDIPLLGGGLT